MRSTFLALSAAILLCGCSGFTGDAVPAGTELQTVPDIRDVTVPSNIAPPNFTVVTESPCRTVFRSGDYSCSVRGRKVSVPRRKWRKLTSGSTVSVTVYTADEGGWSMQEPFAIHIGEPVDRYVTYRLIPPAYQSYGTIRIEQRDLTSFRTRLVYSNDLVQDHERQQCVNCHHFRNHDAGNMQFHTRQYKGGTVILKDGRLKKVDLKTDSTLSAGVYPAWHPTDADLIAYSVNSTTQNFHTVHPNRIEVMDLASDLILYDIGSDSISIIESDPDEFECFPAWAPDGKTLYYVSAHFHVPDSVDRADYIYAHYSDFHYDLYRKPFDPETRTWGKSVKVIDAASANCSITLPRVSPDGRYLLFTMARYGVFHIWHKDADLYMADLEGNRIRPLKEINSREVESYHSWSSGGRWMIFCSRRYDGNHTRLYLTCLNPDGTFTKPFLLPQRNPETDNGILLSYSIPEFTTGPVPATAHGLASFVRNNEAVRVRFRSDRNN